MKNIEREQDKRKEDAL
jgi:hypothetical protein